MLAGANTRPPSNECPDAQQTFKRDYHSRLLSVNYQVYLNGRNEAQSRLVAKADSELIDPADKPRGSQHSAKHLTPFVGDLAAADRRRHLHPRNSLRFSRFNIAVEDHDIRQRPRLQHTFLPFHELRIRAVTCEPGD